MIGTLVQNKHGAVFLVLGFEWVPSAEGQRHQQPLHPIACVSVIDWQQVQDVHHIVRGRTEDRPWYSNPYTVASYVPEHWITSLPLDGFTAEFSPVTEAPELE